MNALYIVVAAGSTWQDIYAAAASRGRHSNDFIGCRTFTAKSGRIVVKISE